MPPDLSLEIAAGNMVWGRGKNLKSLTAYPEIQIAFPGVV
jgi:hypothetical protein